MSKNKVDLTYAKKILVELEVLLDKSYEMKQSSGPQPELAIELNKAAGLAHGMMLEAGMLLGDIQRLITLTTAGPGAGSNLDSQDFIKSLMGTFKGTGNTN